MRSLHLFAGAGGGLLADLILGHTPIGAVENNAYCCDVLRARRDDGWFPGLRVHEQDIRLFDPSEYAGRVDIVAGGFPCQDISAAGKGAGITGERSGLWSEFARVIRLVRPRFVFVENSPMLTLRGLDVVLADLAALGFDAVWEVVSAAHAGAPHRRERIWILAEDIRTCWQPCPDCDEWWCNIHQQHAFECECPEVDYWTTEPYWTTVRDYLADANGERLERSDDVSRLQGLEKTRDESPGNGTEAPVSHGVSARLENQLETRPETKTAWGCGDGSYSSWWGNEPGMGRVANGVAHRVDRLKALGNGQVPLQAALAWRLLSSRL